MNSMKYFHECNHLCNLMYNFLFCIRYQTLLAQCKETISKWETICEEHSIYSSKRADIHKHLNALEERLSDLQKQTDIDVSEKVKKLQSIISERDQNAGKISEFIVCDESLFPDTATNGREAIRKELKEIKERFVRRKNIFFQVLFIFNGMGNILDGMLCAIN